MQRNSRLKTEHSLPDTFQILRLTFAHVIIDIWRLRMKFNVTIDRDEDGVWVVECPAIPGCISQGNTKEEALENIKEAITLCLEVRTDSSS
jgi:predicted RNase H-like HicB family nuclease